MLFISPIEAIEWLMFTTQGFTCWPSHLHSSCALHQCDAAEPAPSGPLLIRTKLKQGTLEPLKFIFGAPCSWLWPMLLDLSVDASSPATATILPGAVLIWLTARQHLEESVSSTSEVGLGKDLLDTCHCCIRACLVCTAPWSACLAESQLDLFPIHKEMVRSRAKLGTLELVTAMPCSTVCNRDGWQQMMPLISLAGAAATGMKQTAGQGSRSEGTDHKAGPAGLSTSNKLLLSSDRQQEAGFSNLELTCDDSLQEGA